MRIRPARSQKPNLDRVLAARPRQQGADLALEKGCVHAEFQRDRAPEALTEVSDQSAGS